MAYVTKPGNYVKFLRGTPDAWQSLQVKNTDTLYFISEDGADRGQLYLGAKLIADGDSATLLKGLDDVSLSEGILNNSLLVYDSTKAAWVNKSLDAVMSLIVDVMVGATADTNGTAGLVPVPLAGQEGLFLQGSGKWANPTEQVEEDLADLTDTVEANAKAWQNEIFNLRGGKTGTIEDIATDVANAAVAKIVASAPESFDTLQEIAKWIQDHDDVVDITDLVSKVTKHETDLYGTDEKEGLVAVVGNLDTVVNDPATGLVVKMSTMTGNINALLARMTEAEDDILNIEGDITEILALLKWQDLVLEEETTTS